MPEPFPEILLGDTLWDFAGQPAYSSRAAFVSAVLDHHREAQKHAPEIVPEECWQPARLALRSPRIVVEYYCDPPGVEESWREVELASDDGEPFTEGELLHTLHNAIIEHVRDSGHHWFEGLSLEGVNESGVPIYRLVPGS